MRFWVHCALIFLLSVPSAMAECDFSKIQRVGENYLYTPDLHVCVGELIRDNRSKDQQIVHLKKAIELSDLALSKSMAQNQSWVETSLKVQEQVAKYREASEMDGWLKFGLGVAVTALAVYGAGSLRH